jgi:hypothetical protein
MAKIRMVPKGAKEEKLIKRAKPLPMSKRQGRYFWGLILLNLIQIAGMTYFYLEHFNK